MDMKKISKPRMDDYDYERKQRREREKSERQQVQTSSSNREVALFSEPRRLTPSEADDDISAKLGDYSKVKDFINLYTVGISNSGHRQMPPNAVLPGIVPNSPSVAGVSGSSFSSSSSSSSQRLQPPPTQAQTQTQQQQPAHHYQQHQQQLRQAPYVKQVDNKPPYNGRGGYPGQPVNRLSSGMAPPKGPPMSALSSSSSSSLSSAPAAAAAGMGSLIAPSTTHSMPNGRQTSSATAATNEKSYLAPPLAPASSNSTQHNGRFSQPSIPKPRQKPIPTEDINQILSHVTSTFQAPKMLTGIDATPHNTLIENYNLSEPNKHKYSFDITAKVSAIEPLLDSPPRYDMAAPRSLPPPAPLQPSAALLAPPSSLIATQMPSTQSASSSSAASQVTSLTSSSVSNSTYIAPLPPAPIATAVNMGSNAATASTSSTTGNVSVANITSSPTVPLSPLLGRTPKDGGFLKPLKSEKPTPPPLERHDSMLEGDLELSESDDEHPKPNHSAVNSSDSSPSDSSESGSESSKSESNPTSHSSMAQLQMQQQQMAAASMASKKKPGVGSAGMATSSSSSSGLGSSAPPSGGSSSSSSNKTPSPSNTTKWQLSRFFSKAPLHQTPTQDVVSPSTASSVVNSVNSMNVANLNMPITLKGGAQIIPEPPQQLTNIKNESLLDDQDDEDEDDEDDDDDNMGDIGLGSQQGRRPSRSGKNDGSKASNTFPASASAVFAARKTPASLSVTPLSPILTDIKKEAATPHPGQQVSDYAGINSNPIKHETMTIGGGLTTVTPFNLLDFNNLSSDSNSNDESDRHRIPVRLPGGTLHLPGVPADITALPRSPPVMQKTTPTPNTVTMTPIGPLPSSPSMAIARTQQQAANAQARQRKPRKKLKQVQSAPLAPNTSDEEQDDVVSKNQRLVSQVSSSLVASSNSAAATAGAAKKARGRPRKTTPNQSGNLSSNSSASTSAKGPTLTAKKNISSKQPPASMTSSATTQRRKASRQNSSSEKISAAVPPSLQPMTSTAAVPVSLTSLSKDSVSTVGSSDDSCSSSDSSSYSNSKSSSSSSDSEEDAKNSEVPHTATNFFSSDDDQDDEGGIAFGKHKKQSSLGTSAAAAAAPKRIVKKLNTRKSSLEDLSTAVSANSSAKQPNNVCLSSSSSSCSSSDSSDDEFRPRNANQMPSAAAAQAAGMPLSSGSSSQRSANHQSPYKAASVASSRSRKPTSCSSAFSSESSAEDQSDLDSGDARKEKKLKRDKPKSDKNKISTLTRIFKTSNEGGAKKQGQVHIIDQSEEQQQQQLLLQQQQQQQQKHISPALRGSQENLSGLHNTPTHQSPRLTPGGHMRSPRSLVMPPLAPQVLTAGALMAANSHRTPDRITTSAERKLQQRIKTPTRTPTRTPPTTRTPTPTPATATSAGCAPANASSLITTPSTTPATTTTATAMSSQPLGTFSLICKIDLSRLSHIPAKWYANTNRLHGLAGAGRTPIYDHETILNADLQSCNTQMRLKTTSMSGGNSSSNGGGTPRSVGSRTPSQVTVLAADRELSHSRESLHELPKENGSAGRLSSRSTDGSLYGGNGGSTPKDTHLLAQASPNGYTTRGYVSPHGVGGKIGLTGVKHEQMIKNEPDAEYSANACTDTKFKTDSTDPALIKQELPNIKQDFKPSELSKLANKTASMCSPNDMQVDAKPKRKRSSSSSPYKEKKRKKDKEGGEKGTGSEAKEKDKMDIDALKPAKVALDEALVNGEIQKDHHMLVDPQFPHTNHDRLQAEKQKPVPKSSDKPFINNNNNSNNANHNSTCNVTNNTASPAHLPNNNNSSSSIATGVVSAAATMGVAQTIMPPPANVAPIAAAQAAANAKSTATTASNPSTNAPTTSAAPSGGTPPATAAMSPKKLAAAAAVNAKPQVIYRSYFERDDDAFVRMELSKDSAFLSEAIERKHAADNEKNTFNQVTLYLEAVLYFLLAGANMEQHTHTENAAWTIYKDTLTMIKFISTKFRHLQPNSLSQQDTHNKVAILSLRCQSLISLKLYEMRRSMCRQINNICSDYFRSGKSDMINGSTPLSISPSNSGSGSNTPPGKLVPEDILTALHNQNQFFNYLASCHELWEQADRLVRQGNYTDFFIKLDHEHGPLTLHSSVYEVFRYVQAGLKKLKAEMLIQ